MAENSGKAWVRATPWKTPVEEQVKAALGEMPAYVRRAKNLEEAIARLWREAAAAREEMLLFVLLRLRRVLDLRAADGPEIDALREEAERWPTWRDFHPRPHAPVRKREPEKAVDALRASVTRFNSRWRKWLKEDAPLDEVNRKIEGYNRHYEFERQCALKYVPLNKVTFRKKKPMTAGDFTDRHPLLPVPSPSR